MGSQATKQANQSLQNKSIGQVEQKNEAVPSVFSHFSCFNKPQYFQTVAMRSNKVRAGDKGNQTALTVSASTSEWLKTVSFWPLGDIFSLSLVCRPGNKNADTCPIWGLQTGRACPTHNTRHALEQYIEAKQRTAAWQAGQAHKTAHGWGLVAWKKHLVPHGNSRKTNVRPEEKKQGWSKKTIQLLLSPLSRSPDGSV